MKTKLPHNIETVEEAKAFLAELHANGESYHPEDNTFSVNWHMPPDQQPNPRECEQLNHLMKKVRHIYDFDPCGYLLMLSDKTRFNNLKARILAEIDNCLQVSYYCTLEHDAANTEIFDEAEVFAPATEQDREYYLKATDIEQYQYLYKKLCEL